MIERGLAERPGPDVPGQFAWADERRIAETLDAAGFGEHHVEALDFAAGLLLSCYSCRFV